MGYSVKGLVLIFACVFTTASLLVSCKPKCYYCVVTDPELIVTDTINEVCTDSPQYTGSYLQSWKVACQVAGGETEMGEGE